MDGDLLKIYSKIQNSENVVHPNELKKMLNKLDNSKNINDLIFFSLIDLIHSFYNLGFISKSKPRPVSP